MLNVNNPMDNYIIFLKRGITSSFNKGDELNDN
jgi:hypothetical protein